MRAPFHVGMQSLNGTYTSLPLELNTTYSKMAANKLFFGLHVFASSTCIKNKRILKLINLQTKE